MFPVDKTGVSGQRRAGGACLTAERCIRTPMQRLDGETEYLDRHGLAGGARVMDLEVPCTVEGLRLLEGEGMMTTVRTVGIEPG